MAIYSDRKEAKKQDELESFFKRVSQFMFIDTHAHLNFPDYKGCKDEIIQRAFDSGIEAIIIVGTDLKASQEAINLAEKYEGIYVSVGVHPHDARTYHEKDLSKFEELCRYSKVIAVGEIGLDFYRNLSPREVQKRVFREFIRLAKYEALPIIIHNRQAHKEIFSILQEENATEVGGVFHCFSGDTFLATKVIDMEFHLSFTGVITFENSRAVTVLKEIPIAKLLLETDSPFMAPEPHRGRRNEPAYVRYVAEKMAQVKELTLQEVAEITSQSARNLFKLKP